MTSRGCLRWAARVDGNQRHIVIGLRKCGASVDVLPGGKGRPDLLVGYVGANRLLEVKKPGNDLQQVQREWAEEWRGEKPIKVETLEEALRAIGAIK